LVNKRRTAERRQQSPTFFYGCILPKKDATISGYDFQSSLRHVYGLGHGKIVTCYSDLSKGEWTDRQAINRCVHAGYYIHRNCDSY
jgi:hypothetical protein